MSEDKETEDYIQKEIDEGKLKRCPSCTILTEKDGGCNWILCSRTECAKQWCYLCSKIKFIEQGCDDSSHNSH